MDLGGHEKYPLRELEKERRERKAAQAAQWERLWMGVVSGVAVIGPMVLIVLQPSTFYESGNHAMLILNSFYVYVYPKILSTSFT